MGLYRAIVKNNREFAGGFLITGYYVNGAGGTAVPLTRHSRESGTKSAEADLYSLWLARRAKYMDVFRNPVVFGAYTDQ